MTLQQWEDLVDYAKRELAQLAGLVAALAGASAAFALPPPWHDRVLMIAALAGVVSTYLMKPFRSREQGPWKGSDEPKE